MEHRDSVGNQGRLESRVAVDDREDWQHACTSRCWKQEKQRVWGFPAVGQPAVSKIPRAAVPGIRARADSGRALEKGSPRVVLGVIAGRGRPEPVNGIDVEPHCSSAATLQEGQVAAFPRATTHTSFLYVTDGTGEGRQGARKGRCGAVMNSAGVGGRYVGARSGGNGRRAVARPGRPLPVSRCRSGPFVNTDGEIQQAITWITRWSSRLATISSKSSKLSLSEERAEVKRTATPKFLPSPRPSPRRRQGAVSLR